MHISYNLHEHRSDRGKGRKIPREAFVKVGFELLIDRSLNIEESEGASNIEEKGPHGEILSWTCPIRECHMGDFSKVGVKLNREGIGEPRLEN